MINNLIFDLGGVVVNFSPKEYLQNRFGDPALQDLLFRATFDSPQWKMLDAGTITPALAERQMLEAAGKYRYEAQLVLDDWMEMLKTNMNTVRLLLSLHKSGYHLYYLSNISETVFKTLCTTRRFMQLFEGGVASYSVHLLKPDEKIFTLLLNNYRLDPKETVLVDDRSENSIAASALGMRGLWYTDPFSFRSDLLSCGIRLPADSRHHHAAESAEKKPEPRKGLKALISTNVAPYFKNENAAFERMLREHQNSDKKK